jgi:death-on-curing protein
MITVEDILKVHDASINTFGGSKGIRDMGMLESAIARPFQTFGGEELYPTPIEKAAALCESLIVNHPFVDGNKRTGFAAMVALLMEYGSPFTATEHEAYSTMIKVSIGEMGFDALKEWLAENTHAKMVE